MLPARCPVQKKEATYDDILALPRGWNGQIIDGELFASPRPAMPHGYTASSMGGDLIVSFDRGRGGPGGWWILDEPELHFGKQVLIPDLGGWRKSRLPVIPPDPYLTLAPDWVCEILSPSTASFDRIKKSRVYAYEGVAYLWFVDPEARTLETYKLDEQARWVQLGAWGEDEKVRAEPFEAVELDLKSFWLPRAAAQPAAPEGESATE